MSDNKDGELTGDDVIVTDTGDVSKDLEQDLNVEFTDSERIIYLSNITLSNVTVFLCRGCRHEAAMNATNDEH